LTAANVVSFGILVADIFVPPLEAVPAPGALVATDDFLFQAGGCAANVAVALRRLGVAVEVEGTVGQDRFGDLVVDQLAAAGIGVSGIGRTAEHGTSKTVILSVRGEDRRYIHTFGANAAVGASTLGASSITSAGAVYIGGFLILPGLHADELARKLQTARASGTVIVLDVATASGEPTAVDDLATVLPSVDYFVPNEDEAATLTGEADVRSQARWILDRGARCAVIKRGERGVYVRTAHEELELPAPTVEVVDPSGAGDAFAAGLIAGILEGWSLEQSVRFASVIGASACTALGCSAGIPQRAYAERLLDELLLTARR
jgi:sugar/nucleoside kinase (ribokinase family)